jgi:hypothetical protein
MYIRLLIGTVIYLQCVLAFADDSLDATYRTLVSDTGTISLPADFRTDWTFLGTWSIDKKDVDQASAASGHGAAGLHNVYTQSAAAKHYQQHGSFPDGAVLIKELLTATTGQMTTGTVSWGTQVEGWFVMVKDTQGRFKSNPLWGDGWGWALIKADQPDKTATQNYKTECLGCHIPARDSDWIYVYGYPLLTR